MRIAYFSMSDQLGGSEVALVEMVRGMRSLRPAWSPLAILPGRGPLLDRLENSGAQVVVLPLPSPLARIGESAGTDAGWTFAARAAFAARLLTVAAVMPPYERRLSRVLRTYRPDIVHTNGLKAHVLGVRAAAAVPTVWHMHEYISHRPVTRRLLGRHAPGCSMILANSRSVADDVQRALAATPPIRVLHNAVDLRLFGTSGPVADLDRLAGLGPPRAPVVRIGLVATFGRWKGHEVFLRALAALPDDLPVRGYVIGAPLYDTAGSQRPQAELQAMAAGLGLSGRVGFTGYVPAPEAMRALDVVVHASTQPEPFGLVIAEAMSCGRPVVTSGLGGASELIEPGRDSLTHHAGDPASLALAMARLVRDPRLRHDLGRRAQAAARARFDPDRFARSLVDVYEGLMPDAIAAGRAGIAPAVTTTAP
jgi:glycosyltransferase involved in cell wall biosynthesis